MYCWDVVRIDLHFSPCQENRTEKEPWSSSRLKSGGNDWLLKFEHLNSYLFLRAVFQKGIKSLQFKVGKGLRINLQTFLSIAENRPSSSPYRNHVLHFRVFLISLKPKPYFSPRPCNNFYTQMSNQKPCIYTRQSIRKQKSLHRKAIFQKFIPLLRFYVKD